MCGPVLGKDEVADLAQYGVIKYFAKPIKFDIFFESIGRVLRMPFAVDDTPCILDIHLSKNIIFIEIALGLNHEKIAMLKYRLSDIIEKNHLAMPTVILMLTSLSLSFVDGYNLEYLFETVTSRSARSVRSKQRLKTTSLIPSSFPWKMWLSIKLESKFCSTKTEMEM